MRLSFQAPQAEAAEERPFATVQTGLKGAAVVVDGVLRALKVSPYSGGFVNSSGAQAIDMGVGRAEHAEVICLAISALTDLM